MTENLSSVLTELKNRFNDDIINIEEYKGENTVYIKKSAILSVAKSVKNDFGFLQLLDVLGTDRFTDEDRFEVIYHLRNLEKAFFLRLIVRVDESDLNVDSVTSVWETANWHERETFDMYGVNFTNHPDMRRMYMPQDFAYYPLRKDYPLIGLEGSIPLPSKEPNPAENE